MAQIHQTAIIGNDVELADSVFVGPYCIIEDHVKIGATEGIVLDVTEQGLQAIAQQYPGFLRVSTKNRR